MTRAEALEEHGRITRELAERFRERGPVHASEKESKLRGYAQAQGSDKNRDHIANFNAMRASSEVIKLNNEIEALRVELEHIRYTLTYGTT